MHYRGVSGVYSEATLQMFEGGSTSTSTSASTSTSTSAADWERPSTLLPPRPVSASCGGFRLCKKCPNHVGPLVTWPARSQIIVSATIMIAGCTLSVSLSGWTRWLNDGQSIFWSNHNLLQRGNLWPFCKEVILAILRSCSYVTGFRLHLPSELLWSKKSAVPSISNFLTENPKDSKEVKGTLSSHSIDL